MLDRVEGFVVLDVEFDGVGTGLVYKFVRVVNDYVVVAPDHSDVRSSDGNGHIDFLELLGTSIA